MASIKSNILLPVMALLLVGMGAFVVIKSFDSGDNTPTAMGEVPVPAAPDADSPAETLRTLQARVADMTAEATALRQANEQLSRDNKNLLDKSVKVEQLVDSNVQKRMDAQSKATQKREQERDRKSESRLTDLMTRIDDLASDYKNAVGLEEPGIPVGLGLDGFGDTTIWHEPLDLEPVDPKAQAAGGARPRGMLRKTGYNPAQPSSDVSVPRGSGAASGQRRDAEPFLEPTRPVYTVPENATLAGSTAFTALVGRIPIGGKVDPWPFKVITGAENMAANGLKLPEVSGMVWSGMAQGDWTLGCVRGWVTSVTFLFRDGRVRTISKGNKFEEITKEGRVVAEDALGWISDEFGTPCISGKRVSNAAEYLTQRVLLNTARTAAEAAAGAQVNTVVGGALGTITQSIQDNDQYIIGKSIAGGVDEIDKWLTERQQQSFDAVFVRAGRRVAIHVTEPLEIDYDPQGRKLRYANQQENTRNQRLD